MAKGSDWSVKAGVLAAYSVRRRVVRTADGSVSILWGNLGVRVDYAEFLDLAEVLEEAGHSPSRFGELARGIYARVVRCTMGQVTLHQRDLTLWFSPDEFEDLASLVVRARQKLADAAPPPPLGLSWRPEGEMFGAN